MSKLKKLSFKVYGLLLIGIVAVFAIIFFSIFAKKYYYSSYNIIYNLNRLDKFENQLNYNILNLQ